MMPTPEQARMPWITTVLVTLRVSLAKAGKAASITCEIAQNVARPMIDWMIWGRSVTVFRFVFR